MDRLSEQLVRRIYPALAAGDLETLREIFSPGFEAHTTEGLPLGLGGTYSGLDEAWGGFWAAIGRAFAIQAKPEQWIPCDDGRLLVLGTYSGRTRSDGAALDAAFAHLWAVQDEKVVSLWHLTDSARWWSALDTEETA